jgi:hypothetical protein
MRPQSHVALLAKALRMDTEGRCQLTPQNHAGRLRYSCPNRPESPKNEGGERIGLLLDSGRYSLRRFTAAKGDGWTQYNRPIEQSTRPPGDRPEPRSRPRATKSTVPVAQTGR